MRDPFKDKGRIEHMLEMATKLHLANHQHSLEEVKNDVILFYGLTKMTEIIGEAAYKLTLEFREEHPEIPWREIIGMRHLLVHGYFSVNPEILWDVIQNDIPEMIPILTRYLDEFQE